MNPKIAARRHVVVFDCNVYLDVAQLTGEPFTWAQASKIAAQHASSPIPFKAEPAVDSLRAIAVCTSGRLAGEELLEVWTSEHIRATVVYKAMQSAKPDPTTGYRGLGWSQRNAESLADELLAGIVNQSGGGDTGPQFPDGNPPLDHEGWLGVRHLQLLGQGRPAVFGLLCDARSQFHRSSQAGTTAGTHPSATS